ncbi:ATP-binding protein [Nocardia sp. NPDC127579]|uniref:ATP-binding protein n=1 Tax=Nocardia sp. NPDC127579 TaxID=3345402 RepID=UPI003630E203
MSRTTLPAELRAVLGVGLPDTNASGPEPPRVSDNQGVDGATDDGNTKAAVVDRKSSKALATVLYELAISRYYAGVTTDGDGFAVRKGGSHLARMLRAGKSGLRAELASAYHDAYGKTATQQALTDALLTFEGKCREAEPTPIHLRVARHEDTSFIDLGDNSEHAVRIDSAGWSVMSSDVPVLFHRTRLTGAFPQPERNGSLSALWEVVNVTEPDRPLVLAWLVAALISPDTPHPILSLFAEQGSGKSSATRILAGLVDPSPVPLRKPPKDMESWVTAAQSSWVVAIDNLSRIPEWLSDSMCRAVTGDGDVRRALYTDGDVAVFAFRRCLLVNGIDVGATRGDYGERCLPATLAPIAPAARRTESELARYWTDQYPRVLGALLDLAASVMAELPAVILDSSPRMADFARILAAVDRVGDTKGLARYLDQSRALAVDSLDSDPFVVALRDRLADAFTGTAAELRSLVTPTDERWRAPSGWPRDARAVSSVLRRNAPGLRAAGWTLEDLGRGGRNKTVRWQLSPPPREGRDSTPVRPHRPQTLVSGDEFGGRGSGRMESAGVVCPPIVAPGGDGGHRGGHQITSCPPGNTQLTWDDGHSGRAGITSGPSHINTDSLTCPECGLDGVPAGVGMHYDCQDMVSRRAVGITSSDNSTM